MKTQKFLNLISCLFFLFLLFVACSEELSTEIENESSQKTEDVPITRAASNNYFDWENSYQTNMRGEKGEIALRRLPWQSGINNPGVPTEWYDPYIEESNLSLKRYTREKGWELVYSNLNEATAYKYIGMYNKYTGIMRFFMCIFAEPGGTGTSSSIWGIRINKPTSLFNFTYTFAKANSNLSPSPAFVTTPQGTFTNSEYQGVGMQNGAWYGFEFVCAYDPSIPINSNNHYFTLMGRAINKTITVGTMETTGTISGTVKGTIPTSSTSLSFNDMFNNSVTDKSVNLTGSIGVNYIGEKIDAGISKNSSFYKELWNNIKGNASKWITSGLSSGAKKGIEAIVSQGGSVVGDALGGLFNSLIGSKNKQVDLKVDLNLKTSSDINLVSTTITQGWSDVLLPVPGSTNIVSNQPIYNNLLGVWNLIQTPKINIVTWTHELLNYPPSDPKSLRYDSYSFAEYRLNLGNADIALNPAIKNLVDVTNLKTVILFSGSQGPYPFAAPNTLTAYSLLDYYRAPERLITHTTPWNNQRQRFEEINFKVLVSFDLVMKSNRSIVYTHARVFDGVIGHVQRNSKPIWNKETPGLQVPNPEKYKIYPPNWLN